MALYQQYYQEMIDQNKKLFADFQDIHDQYVLEPAKNQDKFNVIGAQVVEVIRDYERKLCGHSEKGQFGKFSQNLSDKFWALVRADFRKIDFVGVK
jgi:hypothetical protein